MALQAGVRRGSVRSFKRETAVILGTLLLTLAQPAASQAATMPTCSLVTPRGDRIEFFIWGGDDPRQFHFTGLPGSAWPSRTLAGTRTNLAPNLPWFIIGGADGVALTLNPPVPGESLRAATIVARSRRLTPMPLAYGYCDERPAPERAEPPADRNATEADSPVFDPALWPDQDCALLLSDGRRVRFRFTLDGNNRVRIQSDALWSGAPATALVRWVTGSQVNRATFTSPDGPQGDQMMMVNGTRGSKLVRFLRLGGGSPPGMSGYGICGYRSIVRRPNN